VLVQFRCGTRILRVILRAGRPCHLDVVASRQKNYSPMIVIAFSFRLNNRRNNVALTFYKFID